VSQPELTCETHDPPNRKQIEKNQKANFFFKKIMLNNEIKKVNEPKKGMSTHVNIMNP
jgi:stress-induced morphogen